MDQIIYENNAISSAMEIEPAQSNKRSRESEIGLNQIESFKACEPSSKKVKACHSENTIEATRLLPSTSDGFPEIEQGMSDPPHWQESDPPYSEYDGVDPPHE